MPDADNYVIRPRVFNGPQFEVAYDSEGYLGVVDRGAMFLKISTAKSHIAVQIKDENGKGSLRKEGNARRGIHAEHTVRLKDAHGDFFSKPGENDIRIVLVSECGELNYLHYAIISQNGDAWLVQQPKAEGQLYRDSNGHLQMTEKVRPELLKVLEEVNQIKALKLPDVSLMPPPMPEPGFPALGPGEGIVKWFDDVRQVGAIRTNHNGQLVDVKVHFADCPVRSPKGWRGLAKGERVKIGKITPTVEKNSRLKFQAKDVVLSTPVPEIH